MNRTICNNEADIKKICHACLDTSDNLHMSPDYHNFIEVRANRQLPSALCSKCIELYNICIQFKTCAKDARIWLTETWKKGQLTQDNIQRKKSSLITPVKFIKIEAPPFFKGEDDIRLKNLMPHVAKNDNEPILQFLDSDDDLNYEYFDDESIDDEDIDDDYKGDDYEDDVYKNDDCESNDEDYTPIKSNSNRVTKVNQTNTDSNIQVNITKLPTDITIKKYPNKIPKPSKNLNKKKSSKKSRKTKQDKNIKPSTKNQNDFYLIINEKDDDDFYIDDEQHNDEVKLEPTQTKAIIENYFNQKFLSMEEQHYEFSEILNKRIKTEKLGSAYRCDICFLNFKHSKRYEGHMKTHIQAPGDLSCNICNRHWADKAQHSYHMLNHQLRLSCMLCDYVGSNRAVAAYHFKSKHGQMQLKCQQCDEIFRSKASLQDHMRVKHPSSEVTCGLCGLSFLSIKHHNKNRHQGEDLTIPDDGPMCEKCNIRFANEAALQKHLSISLQHNVIQVPEPAASIPLEEIVDLSQDNTIVIKQAMKKTLVPPEPCELCGKLMNSRMQYRAHFSKAHPDDENTKFPSQCVKKYMCQKCGKRYGNPKALFDHAAVHTGELFKCEVCGEQFRAKSSLVQHKNFIHLGIKFTCNICGRIFKNVQHRDRHLKYIHSTERPEKCDFCDKKFKNSTDKSTHISRVHMKRRKPDSVETLERKNELRRMRNIMKRKKKRGEADNKLDDT